MGYQPVSMGGGHALGGGAGQKGQAFGGDVEGTGCPGGVQVGQQEDGVEAQLGVPSEGC